MGCLHPKNGNDKNDDSMIISNTQRKLKIVMVGLDASGKTSILYYLKNQTFTQVQPTVGLNVETITYKSNQFLLFDVGGKVRSLWTHYYDSLDALIFVVDGTDKERLYIVKDELAKINKDVEFQHIVFLLLFNKCDLPETCDLQTLIEECGVNRVIEGDVIVQKCSAKTGEGLYESLSKLVGFFQHNMAGKLTNNNKLILTK